MHAGLIPSSRKAGWLVQAAQRKKKKKKSFSSISTLAAEEELLKWMMMRRSGIHAFCKKKVSDSGFLWAWISRDG
jgi:hypothetical protein